ncbi:NUAK family SNF1-like kinase 1 [Stylophora pistillata]|uniref:Testis-specific serine/threonine-protein kinase 5 n=1 Tax=Stylophora pistillata TaxID=50429 RepID=A0A2B4SR78_STYPI|nr:NUAK family SNF1-like kinase 1 [Stylophora pistillata]PFX31108.1 Testis-specific serine/threonine-protein kinase 5 [Stylophora pistillata]
MSSRARQPSASVKDIGFVGLRSSMTLEEVDCEKRGYRLTKTVLGTGVYAKVKLAYVMESKVEKDKRLADDLDKKGHNMVAIKVVCKKKAPPEYLSKFMPREIDSLNATCRHHNVIQLYETFHTEAKIYLVMEYASRGDLLDFINSRSRLGIGIGEKLAKHLFRQIAEGVAHCHRRNVVHRDLKCENILLDQDNIVKVSDFGFATRYPKNKCDLLSTFCGSYAYAAPEILQAQKYDGRSADVWSMGVILFAMVCGRLPFNDRSLHSLIVETKTKLAFPSKVTCSADCQHIIRSILAWDPRKRITIPQLFTHVWLTGEMAKVSSVNARSIIEKSPLTLTSIQKEIERVLEEHKISQPERSTPVKQTEVYRAPKTPVPKHGWSSSGNTPEPYAAAKLLHKRDYRLPSKSPGPQAIKIDSPGIETSNMHPPRGSTPCPRSFTPSPQPQMPKKQELAGKVAEILTESGYQTRPTNLSRGTYVVMNKALQATQRSAQTRNEIRGNTQRVWKYVAKSSSNKRMGLTPTKVSDVTPLPKSKDQTQANTNLTSVSLNTVALSPPATEKLVKTALPWRQGNLLHRGPARNPLMKSQQTKSALPTQAQTTTRLESARISRSKMTEATKTCKPYFMNLAIQENSNGRAGVQRIPASRVGSERYPETKREHTRSGSVLNGFRLKNGEGRVYSGSFREVSSRSGSQHGYASGNTDKKHVRFQEDSRQI